MTAKPRKAKPLDNNDNQDAQKVVELVFPLEKQQGAYTNVAFISHSKNEFIFDFVFEFQGQASLVARVITNPEHAKKIGAALATNIQKYEEKFGKIKTDKTI